MKTVKDITITKGRAKQSVAGAVNKIVDNNVTTQINNAVAEERIRTGVITKFYPHLDKAEVQLDNVDQKILCKILHRFGAELTEYYTPVADRKIFCETLKEPAIIPRATQHVCVLNINNDDSEENLILGYYQDKELIEVNPASPGNFKIVARAGTNQFWIKFGYDGLDLRLPSNPTLSMGDMDKDMEDLNYADSNDVYTKDEVYNKEEVYTKSEVDELIAQRIAEALAEVGEDD